MILAAAVAVLTLGSDMSSAQPPQRAAASESRFTNEDLDRWMTKLSNWGRWGSNDQVGAARLMTPAKRREAAALVTEGVSVSMSRRITPSPSVAAADPMHPFANRAIFN